LERARPPPALQRLDALAPPPAEEDVHLREIYAACGISPSCADGFSDPHFFHKQWIAEEEAWGAQPNPSTCARPASSRPHCRPDTRRERRRADGLPPRRARAQTVCERMCAAHARASCRRVGGGCSTSARRGARRGGALARRRRARPVPRPHARATSAADNRIRKRCLEHTLTQHARQACPTAAAGRLCFRRPQGQARAAQKVHDLRGADGLAGRGRGFLLARRRSAAAAAAAAAAARRPSSPVGGRA